MVRGANEHRVHCSRPDERGRITEVRNARECVGRRRVTVAKRRQPTLRHEAIENRARVARSHGSEANNTEFHRVYFFGSSRHFFIPHKFRLEFRYSILKELGPPCASPFQSSHTAAARVTPGLFDPWDHPCHPPQGFMAADLQFPADHLPLAGTAADTPPRVGSGDNPANFASTRIQRN